MTNVGANRYIKQILMDRKRKINSETTVGALTPHWHQFIDSSIDRASGQKISKEAVPLNGTLYRVDLLKFSGHCTHKQQNVHSFQVTLSIFKDRLHVRPHNKSQWIEDRNPIKQLLWSQWCQTGYELQEENLKTHKHMEGNLLLNKE